MRFDLTHAAFRVLERAGFYTLPDSPSEITAAKLLFALLEEEDCRAAGWLLQEGITLESFRSGFGIEPQEIEQQNKSGEQSLPLAAGTVKPAGKHYSVYTGYHPAEYKSNIQTKVRFYLDDRFVQISRLTRELESSLEIIASRINHYSIRQGHSLTERRQIPLNQGIMSVSTQDGGFVSADEPLATEHLLLAASMDESDIGKYLKEHYFEPDALFDRIAKQHQKHSGYFEYEAESEPDDTETDNLGADDTNLLPEDLHSPSKDNFSKPFNLHRVLDAAANRTRESCRVIEDYVRFILNLPELTQALKSFRHRLQNVLSELPIEELLAARDTENDIGTSLETDSEYRRRSPADVLAANFSRLQESLRCLEEFSKIETPSSAKQLEQLRYESYTLQKELLLKKMLQKPLSSGCISENTPALSAVCRLLSAEFYILLDCRKDAETFAGTVSALINGGADMLQLRDKTADDRTLLRRGKLLRQLLDASNRKPLFIVNDRPDLAVLTNADGVHIGQNELPVNEVRKIIGNKIIGVSTHSIEQAKKAVSDGADYIGVGPVFASDTKQFMAEQITGLELLRTAAEELMVLQKIPAFAIGGITLENADKVLQTGIKRIAVSSAVINADSPQDAAAEFAKKLSPQSCDCGSDNSR